MRTHVTFRHPADFTPFSDEDGILAVNGAEWFTAILRRVPNLQIDNDLCQEDWGVVVFVRRNADRFWIGLSYWDDGVWLAHVHQNSSLLRRWFSRSEPAQMSCLQHDIHRALVRDDAVSDVTWYEEKKIDEPNATGFAQPE